MFYVLGAGALWGMISIFVNQLKNAGFNSMECVAIRAFFTAVILIAYLWVKDRQQLKIKAGDVKYFLGTGILSIVFFNYCYFQAIELIGGAAVPALMLYTAPVFVMVMSFFLFKEPLTGQKIAAAVVTFLGLVLVTGAFGGGEKISTAALLFGLGSGFGYALYSIFGKMVVEKYSSITITVYTFVVAAIVTVPASGALRHLDDLATPSGIGAAVGLAVFCTILPYLLYNRGLRRMEAGKASILATAEPVVAAVVGRVLYQEQFTGAKLTGMALVIAAIVMLNLAPRAEGKQLTCKHGVEDGF